jgi:hypothetical protein
MRRALISIIYVTWRLGKQFQLGISKRFLTLKNLNVSEDINSDWRNIKENIRISAKQTEAAKTEV